jgi:hypothetical protein
LIHITNSQIYIRQIGHCTSVSAVGGLAHPPLAEQTVGASWLRLRASQRRDTRIKTAKQTNQTETDSATHDFYPFFF